MKNLLLLMLLLGAVVAGPAAPVLSSVLGFAPATAHAADVDDDDQGENNDDQ